jgi:hypothetical protein
MSVSAWFKTTSNTNMEMLAKAANSGAVGWFFDIRNGFGPAFTIEDASNCRAFVAGTAFNDGAWHHAAATLSGGGSGTITIYVDGVAQSGGNGGCPDTVVSYSNSADIWIGDTSDGTPMNGRLDDLRIYNRALSPAEVQQLYKLGSVTLDP